MNYTGLFNNTGKNDSINLHFAPGNNFDQAIAFKLTVSVLNAFFFFTALLGNSAILLTIWKTCSLHSTANMLLTSLAVCDLAVGLLIQPLFEAVIQKRITTIILVFNILMYVFCCASFFTITTITIDRLLVLQSKITLFFMLWSSAFLPETLLLISKFTSLLVATKDRFSINININISDRRTIKTMLA